MSMRDVTTVLGDPSFTWAQRRTRLQGWRDHDAADADAAAAAQRLAPAACAAGAFVATTGICLPSILFTALWGGERACASGLATAS